MTNRQRTKSALDKALAFERKFDEARDARIKEFTRLISEIGEQPDAEEKLNFIAAMMKDTVLLDRAWEVVRQIQ